MVKTEAFSFSVLKYKIAINAVHIGLVLNKTIPSDNGSNLIPTKKLNPPNPPKSPLIINLFRVDLLRGYYSKFIKSANSPLNTIVIIDRMNKIYYPGIVVISLIIKKVRE